MAPTDATRLRDNPHIRVRGPRNSRCGASRKPPLASSTRDAYHDASEGKWGCHTCREPQPDPKIGKADATCLPGLWLDLDVQSRAHRRDDLPPPIEAARQLLNLAGFTPSMDESRLVV